MTTTTMQLFKVNLRTKIHGSFSSMSSMDKYVERDLELPFPPFVGLTINDGDFSVVLDGPDDDGRNSTEIIYDIQSGSFIVYLPSDREIYDAGLGRRAHRPIDEIVAEYVEAGWKVRP